MRGEADTAPPVPWPQLRGRLPAAMSSGDPGVQGHLSGTEDGWKHSSSNRRRAHSAGRRRQGPVHPEKGQQGGCRLLCSACALLLRASAHASPAWTGVGDRVHHVDCSPSHTGKQNRKPDLIVPRECPSVVSLDTSSLGAAVQEAPRRSAGGGRRPAEVGQAEG